MLQFIKNWTLPLAMLAGVIGYFCFATFDFLTPTQLGCENSDSMAYTISYFCPIVTDFL